MTVLGLTGSFGTGKSFVASVLRSLGAKVLDADAIAHECLKKGRPAHRKVVREFGAGVLGAGGAALIGVDLKKDPAVLHAAYNDAQGVTAEFNLNLLARFNRELRANFALRAFRHSAFYSTELGRIEMHLTSLRAQQVTIGDRVFAFREGETIHTAFDVPPLLERGIDESNPSK